MAKKLNFRREYYTAVSNLLVVNLERDLADFSKHFVGINENYVKDFKEAIYNLKEAESASNNIAVLKDNNKKLYAVLKALKEKYAFIKQYAIMGGIDIVLITKTINFLKTRNVERITLSIRESLAYLQLHKEQLLHMPVGFLDDIPVLVASAEEYNLKQSILSSEGKRITQGRMPIYDALYKYISEVSAAGKLIYKNNIKKDDYTVVKIIAKMQGGAAKQADSVVGSKKRKAVDYKKEDLNSLYGKV